MSATTPAADPAVDGLDVATYTVPTDGPEADGTFAWEATTLVVVTVTGGGRRGLGWSYTAPPAAGLIDGMLRGCVLGRDALDLAAMSEAMRRQVRNIGRGGLAATAISAVDIALWDLAAKLHDLPLTDLLGRATRSVRVYGSGGFTTYDEERTTTQLGGWVHDEGIPRVKIKIGESWGQDETRDLERIALARAVIGPDAELFVDANGAYGVGQAVRMAHRMADSQVTWFEEPVSSDDLAGLHAIRGQVLPDVAAGEYVFDLIDAQRLLAADAVDCLQLDITRCGGVSGWTRGAALAAAHNLQVSGHCAPALHAPVACAVRNVRHLEYFHDHARIEALLFDGAPDPDGGEVTPATDRPGLGLELRAADAERFRVA
jgi:L-alanine-DL-glutamate epimerase-like enolase superfamily enzyme